MKVRHVFAPRTLTTTFFILNACVSFVGGLSDSFTVTTDPASAIKKDLTDNRVFNLSTRIVPLGKGDFQPMFLRWITPDPNDPNNTKIAYYTAAYWVAVDEYTEIQVPSSSSLMVADNSQTFKNISLYYYQKNASNPNPIPRCDLTPRGMYKKAGSTDWVVKSRTVLITLDQGNVKSCEWAPTNCVGSTNLVIDSICADPCPGGSCGYNISLRIAWTGTDSRGTIMRSYERDIWRLQNAFQTVK